METVRVKHVNTVRRRGRLYHYHRKTGERLPDEAEARALRVLTINATLTAKPAAAGSFRALSDAYRASMGFKALADVTRRQYERHLEALETIFGAFPVQAIDRGHVLDLRGVLARVPGRQANLRLAVLRLLLNYAVDRGWRDDNPALRFKRFKEGPGYKAWPLPALAAALERSYPELRLAIGFVLLSALRPGDAVKAAWSNVGPHALSVIQGKTRQAVEIPLGVGLRQLLAAAPRKATTILATPTGRAWQQNWLSREVARVAAEAGFPGLTPHGLRTTAAELAAGEGDAALQAILGHATASQSAHYRRGAEKKRLASKAVERLDEAAVALGFANRGGPLCKTARRSGRKAK